MYIHTCIHNLRRRPEPVPGTRVLSRCFFDLGLVAFRIVSFPQNVFLVLVQIRQKNTTFAVTPLVLTPLVRNQVGPEGAPGKALVFPGCSERPV